MKKIIIIFLLLTTMILSSCGNAEKVKLNGDVNIVLEVFDNFEDPGVLMPDDFTVIKEGEVRTDILGTYEINYRIIDDEGTLFKELTRLINVVDSTPPTISATNECLIYFGFSEDFSKCFIVSDNLDKSDQIVIETNFETIFSDRTPGVYSVSVKATDSNNNASEIYIDIEFILDYFIIIENLTLGDNGIHSIRYDETGGPYQKESYWLSLMDGKGSLNISIDGDFYLAMPYSSLIGSGIVFFSGNFAEMNNTSLSISIRSSSSDEPSWLRMYNFDASKEYTALDLSSSGFDNAGEVDHQEAITIFNENGLIAINIVKDFYEDILKLVFK